MACDFDFPVELEGRLALRPREAAQALGIGMNAIYSLCHQTDFPAVRVGQSFIVPVDGLRRWLLEKEQSNGK